MNALFAAVLLLAVAGDVERCPNGHRTVGGVLVTLTGEACALPASPHTQWWKVDGTWGGEFNWPLNSMNPTNPMGTYEPRVTWLTSEGASACVRGRIPTGQCYGLFALPCARRQFTLKVSDPAVAKISVKRSIGRQGEPRPNRCQMKQLEAFLPSRVRYTDGEWITVTLYTAANQHVCQRLIELDAIGPTGFTDTCDVQQQTWKNLGTKQERVTRNAEDIPREKLPRSVTLELVPSSP